MANNDLIWAKNRKILNFSLREKLDYHFKVKFHGESNGDSLEALKRCLDPEMGDRSLVYGQKSISSKFPHLHGNISEKFHLVISNIFKNMSFLAHSARGALQIFYYDPRTLARVPRTQALHRPAGSHELQGLQGSKGH